MTTTFLRIETRGGNLVAVFDRGFRMWWSNPNGGDGHYDDGTFCLNEQSLRTRIANMKRDGRDTSVEDAALVALIAMKERETTNVQR
jgi:hypothetical protein